MKMPRKPLKKARIEIIPMIDTMFFLLVFFMLATLTMVNQYTLPVTLPHAAGLQDKPQSVFTVTVTRDGKLFCDKEQAITAVAVAQWLERQSKGDKQVAVIINADSSVEHGRVVELMEAIRRSGIVRIAIAVNPDGKNAVAR